MRTPRQGADGQDARWLRERMVTESGIDADEVPGTGQSHTERPEDCHLVHHGAEEDVGIERADPYGGLTHGLVVAGCGVGVSGCDDGRI